MSPIGLSSYPRVTKKQDGLTLVELLVIIGVLAVIIALLLPVINQMRLRADNVRCISNIKTCGSALLLSASESRLDLPLPWGGDDSTLNNPDFNKLYPGLGENPQFKMAWTDYVLQQGLVPNKNVLYCPSHMPRSTFTNPTKMPWGFAYGMRRYNQVSTQYVPINTAKQERQSRFVLLGDSIRSDGYQWYYTHHPAGASKNQFHFRHAGKANLFFLDGSVKSLTPKELLDLGDGWQEGVVNTTPPVRN